MSPRLVRFRVGFFGLVVVFVPACVPAGLVVALGDSEKGGGSPPLITITKPDADAVVAPGTQVTITALVSREVLGVDFFADVDGDLTTSPDQVVIARGQPVSIPDSGFGVASVQWDTSGVASASYAVLAQRAGTAGQAFRGEKKIIVNVPPQLSITVPASDITVSRGGVAAFGYADNDPDNDAQTWLFADIDGDLSTVGDQHPLSEVRPEQNGVPQTLMGELTGVPEALYSVVGVASDAVSPPVLAFAPGRVRVANVAWAKRAGGTTFDEGRAIAALADGSCVMTGYFQGTATFGAGEPNATTLVTAGASDVFVARYTSDGTLVWAKRAGGPDSDEGLGTATLADGSSVVVTGSFRGTATFGAGEPNATTLVSGGATDVFIARYSSDGALAWAKRAGGTLLDDGLGTAAFADGSCVVTGYFQGTATFGAGELNATTLVAAGSRDVFVARYASHGGLTWAKRAGGTGEAIPLGIAAVADTSCVVTGYFQGTATFGAGEPNATTLVTSETSDADVFIARYTSGGALVWAKAAAGTTVAIGEEIAAFADGGCVVTGNLSGTATFGAGEPNATTLVATGVQDVFVARYGSDGALAWAKRAGGMGDVVDGARGIAALTDGSCLVTGYFQGTATFGAGTASTTLVTAGARDVFVARFASNGALVWARRAGGTTMDQGTGIAAFADGSCVVTGYFQGTATFGAADPNATTLVAAGEWDVFVSRFNADGGF